MPSGSDNAQQLKQIIDKAESAQVIQGDVPGTFSISVPVAALAAAPASATPAPLLPGEAALIQSAVNRANSEAAAVPLAGAGSTSGSSPDTAKTIDAVAKGLTNVAQTPADVRALVAGAAAKLHWWGWTLRLNEAATKALQNLLTTDLGGLAAIATALAAVSAPLAAVAAIVTAVAGGLKAWVAAEDGAQQGVAIHGYLWVGVWVSPA